MVTGPVLTLGGACPGPASLDLAGLTPNGPAFLGYSTVAAPWAIPGGPVCVGTVLPIAGPTLLTALTADANGDASFNGNIPPVACGLIHLAGLDVGSCAPTNLLSL